MAALKECPRCKNWTLDWSPRCEHWLCLAAGCLFSESRSEHNRREEAERGAGTPEPGWDDKAVVAS